MMIPKYDDMHAGLLYTLNHNHEVIILQTIALSYLAISRLSGHNIIIIPACVPTHMHELAVVSGVHGNCYSSKLSHQIKIESVTDSGSFQTKGSSYYEFIQETFNAMTCT
jgi:hypothetical protein